jgi:hypothetical protein
MSSTNQNQQPIGAAPAAATVNHAAINGTGMARPGGAAKIGGAAKAAGTIGGASFQRRP